MKYNLNYFDVTNGRGTLMGGGGGGGVGALIMPRQWQKLVNRFGELVLPLDPMLIL